VRWKKGRALLEYAEERRSFSEAFLEEEVLSGASRVERRLVGGRYAGMAVKYKRG